MPIYKFKCSEHGKFEELKQIGDYETKCPKCGKKAEKIMGNSKAHYRATGFTKSTTHL